MATMKSGTVTQTFSETTVEGGLAELLPGGQDRYEILRHVATGGMGTVYYGRHRQLDRPVAIKVCLPGSDNLRFRREAQLLATLRSPFVIQVHDFDTIPDGRAILVMDWIDGPDLKQKLEEHPDGVPEELAIRWMEDVCQGMLAAEKQQVVHRDLKPSNILLEHDKGRALVADFGLARSPLLDSITSPQITTMGTPYYMAPEQAEDPHNVGSRADVYSFGATFYHLLTGQPPFNGATPFSVLFKHKTEPLISPRSLRSDLSTWLSEVIERCMAKSPADRFGSFHDVLTAIRNSTDKRSWDFDDDPQLQPYLVKFQQVRQQCLYAADNGLASPIEFTFPHDRVLTLNYGNIANQKVDAVVSSDDGWLSMGGGVSASLRSGAGPQLQEWAGRFTPVRAGRAIVTPAGNLPARFVFHGVTIDVMNKDWVLPSRDVIAEIMESCFYHADTLNLRSMAFPLLGSGAGYFPRDLCLDTMFRFLARKFLRGLTSVREVHLMLY